MEKPPETIGNLDVALDAFAKGYTIVAMKPRTKEPAEKWKRWLTREMTEESVYERWLQTNNGIALYCHNLLVIDVDEANRLDFVVEKSGLKHAPICQTPGGGFHVHARLRQGVELERTIKLKGEPFDLLTRDSLSIIPPSWGEDGTPYRWLGEGLPPIRELPYANIGWTRERKRYRIHDAPQHIATKGGKIRDILAYILTIPSVQGENGSKGCYRVCCILRDEGYTPLEAWPLLLHWNSARPEPPWSKPELIHKLESVYKTRLREVLR